MEGQNFSCFLLQKSLMLSCLEGNPTRYSEFRNKLSNRSTIDKIFSVVWELDETHQFMTPTLIESRKSEDEANRMRNEGNVYYRKKNFVKALQQYNLSIMKASHPVLPELDTFLDDLASEDACFMIPQINPSRYGGSTGEHKALAMGYANRSAVMLELGLYEKCLSDINLAFEYSYPADLHEKLENRRRKCQSIMKEIASAPFGSVTKPCSSATEQNFANPYSSDPVALLEDLQPYEVQETPTLKGILSLAKQKVNRIYEQNPNVPSLSSAVRIANVPRKGRGFVAVRNIYPGEVLGVERAYAIAVADDMLSSFCCTCLALCLTPLPCPGCAEVIFCSKACREKGLAEDHWLECKILPTLLSLKVDEIGYCYKLLKTFSHERMKTILTNDPKQICDNPEDKELNIVGIGDSGSYKPILCLSTNEEKYPFEMLLNISLTALVLTKLLDQSGRYFVNERGESLTPTEQDLLQTGTLLVSHAMKLITNCFQLWTSKSPIGHYVFTAMSMLNHSCNPSAIYIKCGREMALRAIRPISAGEEVTMSYTGTAGTYFRKEKDIRTQHIKEKYFQCSCEACKNDWPTYEHLPYLRGKCLVCKQVDIARALLCSSCFFKSMGPHKTVTSSKDMKFLKRASEIGLKLNDDEEISSEEFQCLCEYTEFLHKHFTQPCKMLNNVSTVLEKSFGTGM